MLNPFNPALLLHESHEKTPSGSLLRAPLSMRSVLLNGVFASSTSDFLGLEQAHEFSLHIDHYLALYSIDPSELNTLITELISTLEGKLKLYSLAYPILINLAKHKVLHESLRAQPELLTHIRKHLEDALKLYHAPRMSDELRARFHELTSMTLELLQHLFSRDRAPFNEPEFLSWLLEIAAPLFLKGPKEYKTQDLRSSYALLIILNHYVTDSPVQHHFFLHGVVTTIANFLMYTDQVSTFREANETERALINPLADLCASMLQTLLQASVLSPSFLTDSECTFILSNQTTIRTWLKKQDSSLSCSDAFHRRVKQILDPNPKPRITVCSAPITAPTNPPSASPASTDSAPSPAASAGSALGTAHVFGIALSPASHTDASVGASL